MSRLRQSRYERLQKGTNSGGRSLRYAGMAFVALILVVVLQRCSGRLEEWLG